MSQLTDVALAGRLSTRETLIRTIQDRAREDLYSQPMEKGGWGKLDGPLGEQIAIAAGGFDLETANPEDIAEGFCPWLDKYFLQSPRKDGPREGTEDASPPPCMEGGDGSRVLALAFKKGDK